MALQCKLQSCGVTMTPTTAVALVLPGAPRTKKNSSKIWKVGNRKVVMPSEPWMQWRNTVMASRQPKHAIDYDVNCCALFYRDANRGDSTGYYQGLADVLEEIGVLLNDKHITQWDGSRLYVDRENPRVELTLTPITPAPALARPRGGGERK